LSGADVLMRKIFAGYDDSTNILASRKSTCSTKTSSEGIPDTVRYGEYDQRLVKQFIETQESSNSNGVLATGVVVPGILRIYIWDFWDN
jgi:hypothetical protein